jgi:outer membrane protein OmpA-like peptidoglycan-associated protein
MALAAATGSGWADDYSSRVGVSLGGGAYKLVGGEFDHASIGPWGNVALRFGWRRHWDIEAAYRYGFNWDDTQNFRCRTTGFELGAIYNPNPDGRLSWQVFAGPGVFWWNVMDFRKRPAPGVFDTEQTVQGFREDGNRARLLDSNWKLFGGLGAELGIWSRLSLRAAARVDWLLDQTVDNTGASNDPGSSASAAAQGRARRAVDANDVVPAFSVGLAWWFSDRDSDQDGVPNKSDACPFEAEDRDGYQDEDGCPDLDNDGDGIQDSQDKCPDEAEDKDGFADDDGCADGDNDGDGIQDSQDKCPDEAEDKDGFEDEDGCPDLDNDGDAVPDSLDKCADTPQGTRVDAEGCPIAATPQEAQLLDTGIIRLSNVQFETSKAEIRPESGRVLDEVVGILGRWQMARVEIAGHTDARGSDVKNQELSEQRARAVLDYLRAKFPALDAILLQARGYGESQPVADNATDEGRAQNRRVEFRLLNRDEIQAEIQRRMTPPGAPEEQQQQQQ